MLLIHHKHLALRLFEDKAIVGLHRYTKVRIMPLAGLKHQDILTVTVSTFEMIRGDSSTDSILNRIKDLEHSDLLYCESTCATAQ